MSALQQRTDSVKRHEWRCKSRGTAIATDLQSLHGAHGPATNQAISPSILPGPTSVPVDEGSADETTCVCGRKCADRRGLKTHER